MRPMLSTVQFRGQFGASQALLALRQDSAQHAATSDELYRSRIGEWHFVPIQLDQSQIQETLIRQQHHHLWECYLPGRRQGNPRHLQQSQDLLTLLQNHAVWAERILSASAQESLWRIERRDPYAPAGNTPEQSRSRCGYKHSPGAA